MAQLEIRRLRKVTDGARRFGFLGTTTDSVSGWRTLFPLEALLECWLV